MKKILKTIVLCALAIFASCSDDIYDSHINDSNVTNKKKISLKQFKQETNIKDFKPYYKVPISANSVSSRTADLSEFVIDTVAIQKYISENNKTTYSFRIYSIVPGIQLDEKYNLVIRSENNIWEQTIFSIKENKTSVELTEPLLMKMLLDTKIETAKMPTVCISYSVLSHCEGCKGACDYENCPSNVCYRLNVTTISDCASVGGDQPNPSNPPIDYSGAGYIPINPFEFTPNLYDNPAYDDQNAINQLKAEYFFNHLTPGTQFWVNDKIAPENKTIYLQLIQYQIDNNWSPESETFANQLIDYLIANPQPIFTDDNFPGKNDGLSFEWWKDDNVVENVLTDPYETWNHLTEREKLLIKKFPDAAYQIFKNKDIAFQKTNQYFGNTPGVLNGKADAFRHAFFQALNTKSLGRYRTELFANAHESETPLRWIKEKQMDLLNNAKGINLIEIEQPNLTDVNLIAAAIYNYIITGQLVYLSPINYSDPNFWDNPLTPEPNDGNHGISSSTVLIPSNQ